jgi:hypothetical protein
MENPYGNRMWRCRMTARPSYAWEASSASRAFSSMTARAGNSHFGPVSAPRTRAKNAVQTRFTVEHAKGA